MRPVVLLLLSVAPAWAVDRAPSEQNDLTVTEIMADPTLVDPAYGEWFEIHNNSGENLNLQGLVITNKFGDTIEINRSFAVALNDYIVFAVGDSQVESDPAYNGGLEVNYLYSQADFDLHSSSDWIELSYDGQQIDIVEWNNSWGVGGNKALQVQPNSFDLEWSNDESLNWCPSDQAYGGAGLKGTPGDLNEYCVDNTSVDDDGDGYSEIEGDCNDDDALVNPGVVDGNSGYDFDTDHNCDGVRDDGAIDNDGDGYTELEGDCNDQDDRTYPDARENPDDVDNDCDGCIDNVDEDGDGYRYSSEEDEPSPDGDACREDCNDNNAAINPAVDEVPYDGIDQDCDGGDWCDFDGDGYDAEQFGCGGNDCADDDAAINPGAEEIADGIDNNCDDVVDVPDLDGDGFTQDDGDCMDIEPDADPDGLSVTVFPGNPEACDGLDNDCDGFIDNAEKCAANPAAFATVRGGGICGVTPASGGAFPTLAAAGLLMVAALRRRGGDA
jgi:hypothetical protein